MPCGVLTHQSGTDDGAVGVDDPPTDRTVLVDVVRLVVADLETAHCAVTTGTQHRCPRTVDDPRPAPQAGFTDTTVERGDLHFSGEAESVTQCPIVKSRSTFDDHNASRIGHQDIGKRRRELIEPKDPSGAGPSGRVGDHHVGRRRGGQCIGDEKRSRSRQLPEDALIVLCHRQSHVVEVAADHATDPLLRCEFDDLTTDRTRDVVDHRTGETLRDLGSPVCRNHTPRRLLKSIVGEQPLIGVAQFARSSPSIAHGLDERGVVRRVASSGRFDVGDHRRRRQRHTRDHLERLLPIATTKESDIVEREFVSQVATPLARAGSTDTLAHAR